MAEYVKLQEVEHKQDCTECQANTTVLRAKLAEILMRREGLITRDTTPADVFIYMERHPFDEKAYCNRCLLNKKS